jgi:hypothetical protein
MNEGASQFLNFNDSAGSEGTAGKSELSRPFGTRFEIRQFPALKRRAILGSPSGTEAFKHHTVLEN